MLPDDVAALLSAYGLRSPRAEIARDAAGAVAAARAIGHPVALKLVSDTLTHKSDVGGVLLGLADDTAVAAGWERLVAALASHGRAEAMRGALVQPMVTGTFEAVIGMTLDSQFGPLLMAGLGGKWVELHHDVSFRLHPLTIEDATEMVDALRARVLFAGYRGAPAGDREAYEDALLRVSQLVGDRPEIVELDLNPVVVGAPGCGVTVVDARIRVSPSGAGPRA
jgi:4-hydroxybutyryl-CoA synthetase (ADP-forming)